MAGRGLLLPKEPPVSPLGCSATAPLFPQRWSPGLGVVKTGGRSLFPLGFLLSRPIGKGSGEKGRRLSKVVAWVTKRRVAKHGPRRPGRKRGGEKGKQRTLWVWFGEAGLGEGFEGEAISEVVSFQLI